MKRLVQRSLRWTVPQRLTVRIAAIRRHGLALVYHRVLPQPPPPRVAIVPSVTPDLLRRQLAILLELGDVVDLPELFTSQRGKRPRFAVSFDDDYTSHVSHALPILRDLGVPATFFLGGRALHGAGAYWWERLEHAIAARGLEATASMLDVTARSPTELAAACERDPRRQRKVELLGDHPAGAPLDAAGIATLARAGMRIGFHTVSHPLLTLVSEDRLAREVVVGRRELAEAAGEPVSHFAYPHGKADRRVAAAVRAAGYAAAWTGRPHPSRPDDDPFLLGRWEPGARDPEGFAAAVAVRLHRAAP